MDQAAGLRRMVTHPRIKVIAVTSGKGGVGKTNVAINLAIAMIKRKRSVMLMDADLGLANVDVLLGLQAGYNLSHVVTGQRTLEEVVVTDRNGLMVIPAASGIQRMSQLSVAEHAGLINAFSEFHRPLDTLIVDTAAGISDSVVRFSRAATDVLVVVCDEPASLTDAYALIKVLSRDHGVSHFRILASMVGTAVQGRELFEKLLRVSSRFLDVSLEHAGAIPKDEYLCKAVRKQQALVNAFPRSPSAVAFTRLATQADGWPLPTWSGGHLAFFFERLVTQAG